jgi:hypothetical protein
MGYWSPPTPNFFDPTERPLHWTIGGDGRPYPAEEDQAIFGIGHGAFPGETAPNGLPWASSTLFLGGRLPVRTPYAYQYGKTEADRLEFYRRLIAIRAPSDPPSGGLPADTNDIATGGLGLHYWDLSDAWPKRKTVTFTPTLDGKSINTNIIQWDHDAKTWGEEGFDFERDLIGAIPDIIKAFGTATAALIGYLTGNPVLAAAWSSIYQMSSRSALGGPPPSPLEWASSAATFLGSAPGFGQAMANLGVYKDLQKSLSGNVGKLASIEIANLGADLTSYYSKLRQTVEKYAASIPKIDLSLVKQGIIPPDVQHAIDNTKKGIATFDAKSYELATKAFLSELPEELVMSIRKAAGDKDTFDVSYAALMASAIIEKEEEQRMAYVIAEVFRPATDPFQGKNPRAPLNEIVMRLKARYRI